MKMDFTDYDSLTDHYVSLTDHLPAGQSNLGRHSPCRPSFFSAFCDAVGEFVTIVFGILFVCALACSLPLAIFLMFFASY